MEGNILDYTLGLQQYAIGAQLFIDGSVIVDNQQNKQAQEGESEPALNPNVKRFEPFEINFLKDQKEIGKKSLNPGGAFYIYLPPKECLRELIPFRTGFKVKTNVSLVCWKSKNVQSPLSPDGFAMLPQDKSGKVYLYITYDLRGIVCFEQDKPDDKQILRAVLLCDLEAPPPGIVAANWNFKDHMTQNHVGRYDILVDPVTNTVGASTWGTPPGDANVADFLKVKNFDWKANNGQDRHNPAVLAECVVQAGKITCVVVWTENGMRKESVRYYNSIPDVIADQKANVGHEFIFPIYQTDEFGNVVNDFRLMPYLNVGMG